MATAKKKALKLIQKLSEQASWEDIMYELYVRKKIEEGLKAEEEGRTISHEKVKKRFAQ